MHKKDVDIYMYHIIVIYPMMLLFSLQFKKSKYSLILSDLQNVIISLDFLKFTISIPSNLVFSVSQIWCIRMMVDEEPEVDLIHMIELDFSSMVKFHVDSFNGEIPRLFEWL